MLFKALERENRLSEEGLSVDSKSTKTSSIKSAQLPEKIVRFLHNSSLFIRIFRFI
jgi:hypothetical protein